MISTKLGSLRKLINRYESYQRLYSKLGGMVCNPSMTVNENISRSRFKKKLKYLK